MNAKANAQMRKKTASRGKRIIVMKELFMDGT